MYLNVGPNPVLEDRGCGSPSSTERFSWDKLVWATQTNLKPTFFRFDRFETAIFLYFDGFNTVIFFGFLTDWKPASFFYRTRVRSLFTLVTNSLTHSVTLSKLDLCDPVV